MTDQPNADAVRSGAFGQVPASSLGPLDEDEVAALPDGTRVVIIWSGGNGPSEGIVFTEGEGTYYVPASEDPNGPLRHYNPISFIGSEPFHTRVFLPAPTDGSGATDG